MSYLIILLLSLNQVHYMLLQIACQQLYSLFLGLLLYPGRDYNCSIDSNNTLNVAYDLIRHFETVIGIYVYELSGKDEIFC